MEVDAVQFRASREHIEVALPKLRRPFGSLLLMGYDADQPKGFILLPQNIDDLCSVQPHAGVAGYPKLRDTALAQFHDPLRHLQLHAAAAIVLLVKAPRKPQGMLTDHRTANIFFIIPPPLIVVYWLTISILTAAIFRVNANVSYKHTK